VTTGVLSRVRGFGYKPIHLADVPDARRKQFTSSGSVFEGCLTPVEAMCGVSVRSCTGVIVLGMKGGKTCQRCVRIANRTSRWIPTGKMSEVSR
jgi:hypothetical protein